MKLKTLLNLSIVTVALIMSSFVGGQESLPILDNPMSTRYFQKKLRKSLPRLVYTKESVKHVRKKIKTDSVLQNMYAAIKLNADAIYKEPLLEYIIEGRRLLDVSRELLYRMNMLGFVYLMENDEKSLARINDELLTVCNFVNWNPSHFLDVAEMALGVAIAIDWTQDNLPESTIQLAKKALLEKAILKSWPKKNKKWGIAYGNTNWNQVCAGGLVAASIAIADENPELGVKTIHRVLDGLPNALATYGPDGNYPEGATYWDYATAYSVTTNSIFQSAFGTDFGSYDVPGFKESAKFRLLSECPSGFYFNFSDCKDEQNANGNSSLAWFAMKSGNEAFFKKKSFLQPFDKMDKLSRFDGIAMLWLAKYKKRFFKGIPTAWKGDGKNPIAIFKSHAEDKNQFYLGCKGGRASISHGNMDAGSFVFELNGIRWSIDPGVQGYHELEKEGFNLWSNAQDGDRWTLLTKNNFGHSTLTINNELFLNNAFAPLINFKEGDKPEASFDLSSVFGKNIKKAHRRFLKESTTSLLIEDDLEVSDSTKLITWQMMTTANVKIVKEGAILSQGGKKLRLENISHPNITVSIISLYPSPLKLDKQIEGLKRIEIRIPAWIIESRKTKIKVKLSEF
ncbi:heparinase II/III family protein [Flavivirga abyssicola]|uniref:heparinase II/III domain-containing protein n=1 Tax=Flavivirga abyssicola TaxID=3063533 RepID=UPI0026DFAF0A|nr:heparinase II/III family protein [Flavivirga sp. MEBiC07777]WVK12572.1 heparinase II/III family protein [Flavivirga sp. MEBiC07777]